MKNPKSPLTFIFLILQSRKPLSTTDSVRWNPSALAIDVNTAMAPFDRTLLTSTIIPGTLGGSSTTVIANRAWKECRRNGKCSASPRTTAHLELRWCIFFAARTMLAEMSMPTTRRDLQASLLIRVPFPQPRSKQTEDRWILVSLRMMSCFSLCSFPYTSSYLWSNLS